MKDKLVKVYKDVKNIIKSYTLYSLIMLLKINYNFFYFTINYFIVNYSIIKLNIKLYNEIYKFLYQKCTKNIQQKNSYDIISLLYTLKIHVTLNRLFMVF